MDMAKLTDIASALYDGGWRAEDIETLKVEYGFTDEDAEAVCEKLKEYTEGKGHGKERTKSNTGRGESHRQIQQGEHGSV